MPAKQIQKHNFFEKMIEKQEDIRMEKIIAESPPAVMREDISR